MFQSRSLQQLSLMYVIHHRVDPTVNARLSMVKQSVLAWQNTQGHLQTVDQSVLLVQNVLMTRPVFPTSAYTHALAPAAEILNAK